MQAPKDYETPEWDKAGRAYDWRNYISDELRDIWNTFTLEQKRVIAQSAESAASREEWD